MAATPKTVSVELGADKHETEPGFHGHAGYPSPEDLDTRVRAARGESAPLVEAPLPAPDPAQR